MFHKKSAVKYDINTDPTKHRDSQTAEKSTHSTHSCSCLLPTKQLADEEREGGQSCQKHQRAQDTSETLRRYSQAYIHDEDLGILHPEQQVLH